MTQRPSGVMPFLGIEESAVSQNECRFCHSQIGNPQVMQRHHLPGLPHHSPARLREQQMDTYQPLHCDLHDYLEIACMHGYRLWVECVDGRHFQARGQTTQTRANGEEFLCLHGAEGPLEVRLDQLLAITPLDACRSFGRILLGQPCPA